MTYYRRHHSGGLGALFFLLFAGIAWLCVACWRHLYRRTGSALYASIAVGLSLFAAWAMLAMPRPYSPGPAAALSARLQAARPGIPCIEAARALQPAISRRDPIGGDQVAWMADRIASLALRDGKPPASIPCGDAIARLEGMAG